MTRVWLWFILPVVALATTGVGAMHAPTGIWGSGSGLPEPNSEFAVAEAEGRLYVLGGYPASRDTVRTVQIYDIASDSWTIGPPLPVPNNHGMAASVDGRIYLIGGQTTAQGAGSYVDTVYELDPEVGIWTEKARMPTARSAGVAIVYDGRIYVAGGRPPRGNDFAVYDPAGDRWTVLPDLPSQRNHVAGGEIGGLLYVVGGRLEGGFQSAATDVVEVFDPAAGTWSRVASLPRPRSGVNGVVAFGCLHVWGGEGAAGMFPDHTVYDPRSDRWTRLPDMPIPVHGVTGAAFVGGQILIPGGGTAVGGRSGSRLNQTYHPPMSCQ